MGTIARVLGGVAIAAAVCGFLSVPLLLWPVGVGMAPERQWMPGPPSLGLVLAVAAFCLLLCVGLGVVLIVRGQWALGAGLIVGWVVMGAVTSGWCTGLAPDFYAPERQYRTYVDHFSRLSRDEAQKEGEAELQAALKLG